MDVLYRAGETQQGISTYTPRVLSIGLQGSLGSMSSQGTLYNEDPPVSSEVPTWTSNISTQASEAQKKNLFLQSLYEEHTNNDVNSQNNGSSKIHDKDMVENLENVVQYWTDYSKVHYHPKSLYELNGLWVEPHQFDNYGTGKDAFHDGLREEEITSRLRFFIEDCDHIQGIQFIVDDENQVETVENDSLIIAEIKEIC
ncbi:LOW QUALITY PROTEIN: protein misato homolog 1-like [Impatiens glandulifera]|uniref:LOW QUALITY PROTEIN: protein misato homolog 1-like n=1 Tax=Impatiens glandulifera TaxID=253017 RepID=UPI001FB1584E|nr:LOW QUALITY PROTEIN: protein misato homolog 1-like [Impatiens glandulifera]